MKRSTTKDFVITIKVKSRNGTAPEVRTLCADTVFVNLTEGQTATWTLRRGKVRRK